MEVCEVWLARDFLARIGRPLDIPPCDHPPAHCPPVKTDTEEPPMDTVSYADLINSHFDGAADFLLVELREELETHHKVQFTPADIDTVLDVVRELILVQRV